MKKSPPAVIDADRDIILDAILSASRIVAALAIRSLADTTEDVTLTQYRTLAVLASQGPQRLAALAEAVGVTPATATRMCDRLVGKGLVGRRHDRGDRRLVRLTLTREGLRLVDAVTERRRIEMNNLLGVIPEDLLTALVDSFQLLAAAAGEVREQDWTTGWEL